ncbi:MAG: hypothetical protein KA159_03135 [Halioglobus sp.]|nr:hypothetical protein [Halioglobus sp.]
MNRFNLTFRGEIIEGHDPEQVKARLARMLAVDDPAKLQRLFSGDPVVLRRNMERKEAAGLYARLRQQGIQAELVKIGERGDLHSGESVPATAAAPPSKASTANSDPQPPNATAPDVTAGARKIIRKADLAATKKLRAADSAQLEAKEKALGRALTAKQAEEAKRARARDKALAREADLEAKREAARQQAELAAAKREAEQEAARLREEQRREQAEAAALRQAELERARAQEAAQRAERERLEAEERARLEAEKQQRLAAEKAERERLEAEKRERLAAERAERERLEAEKRERLAAEKAERDRLEAAERERLAAERARQEQARREEQQRLAAEKAARREQEKRKGEQLAAKLQVEQARRKREQAEKAARRKAEELRQRAQEQARLEAEEAERLAQRRAMEEQAIQRAAAELAQKPALKPVETRVRTRLETPSRLRRPEQAQDGGRRKRQPGAPNLYSLRPFRNTPEIRSRSAQSKRSMRQSFAGAALAIAIAILLVLAPGLSALQPPLPEKGARAGAVGPQDRPLLLAGDHLLLHDRSGVGVADLSADGLGLTAAAAPLAFDAAGELLITGRLAAGASDARPQLLRCVLAESRCKPFPVELAGTEIAALVVNPLDGSLLVADSRAGQLLKLSPQGAVLARADASIPAAPVLRLDSGLLLMNSAEGPGISVLRYEDEAFGRQLDEILLLPPAGSAARFTGVRDFLRSGDYWWALLETAGSDRAGLYRFDARWQFVDRPPLTADTHPAGLLNWAGRILVLDPSRVAVQRFSADGMVEAPLVSSVLTELVAGREQRAELIRLGWRIGLTLCVLGAIAALLSGGLHRVRGLVYSSCRERGAEPIDKLADAIDWLELAPNRTANLGRTAITYALLATGLLLAAIGLGVSSLQLSALLLALAGPATALILLQRSDPGNIGIHGQELLLVDHQGMYHMGSGARIHWRGPFLMIDDVIVFSGTPQLPAFAPAELAQRVAPLAAQGVQVDRKIVTVKLLQGRHPLALGALAIGATFAAALALVSLQGIF